MENSNEFRTDFLPFTGIMTNMVGCFKNEVNQILIIYLASGLKMTIYCKSLAQMEEIYNIFRFTGLNERRETNSIRLSSSVLIEIIRLGYLKCINPIGILLGLVNYEIINPIGIPIGIFFLSKKRLTITVNPVFENLFVLCGGDNPHDLERSIEIVKKTPYQTISSMMNTYQDIFPNESKLDTILNEHEKRFYGIK